MRLDPASRAEDSTPGPPLDAPHSSPVRRLVAVDALRGLVMVLMVLDHTRDYLGDVSINPTRDPALAGPALFFTRWVTHLCAPTFAFLAGLGAYLAGSRGRTRGELAAYLATRGLWLIFLELTIERFGLLFNLTSGYVLLAVLWSIGGSFLVLAALVHLPSSAVGALGVAIIATHGWFDVIAIGPANPGGFRAAAVFLLRPFFLPLPGGLQLLNAYPLVPWLGVVAAGYGFGEVFGIDPGRRWRVLMLTGLGLIASFVLLRAWGGHGDPLPWAMQGTPVSTVISFVNCTKQPPSPLFILMTLGPAITLMGIVDRTGIRGPVGRALVTHGRVPLFYYLLQWYVIHAVAVLTGLVRGLPVGWLFAPKLLTGAPRGWALPLPGVYVAWVVVLVVLYPPSRWFAGVKRRHPGGWLSYL